MTKPRSPWVQIGGAKDEWAHCSHCGEGLVLGVKSLPIEPAAAMLKAFIKTHARCTTKTYTEPPIKKPSDWARGRDIGVSAGSIYTAMTGDYSPCGRYDVPHDPADFGRCYRLLNYFPEWRSRMANLSRKWPIWEPFVTHWSELEALYVEELPTGTAPRLYEAMQRLLPQ